MPEKTFQAHIVGIFVALFSISTGCTSVDELFQRDVTDLGRKLPPTARVVVPKFTMHAINKSTRHKDFNSQNVSLFLAEGLRDQIEHEFVQKAGVKVVSREVFNQIEEELAHGQTVIVDTATAAKFGKAAGATHIALGKGNITLRNWSVEIDYSVKLIDVQTLEIVGVIQREGL